MDKSSYSDLSDQLRQRSAPKSPEALDKRILDYARENTPQKTKGPIPQWISASAAFSVMVIAVLLVIQPPTPLEQDTLPRSVITNFPMDNLLAPESLQDSSAEQLEERDHDAATQQDSMSTDFERQIKALPQQPVRVLEEVIVTAHKKSPAMKEAPQPISTLRSDPLSNNRITETSVAGSHKAPSKPSMKSKQVVTKQAKRSAKSMENSASIAENKNGTLDLKDSDNDTLPDIWEQRFDLDPNDPKDALLDLDNDGLSNLLEFQLDTNPSNEDSDDDGLPDGWENDNGSHPLKADAEHDANNNGNTNWEEYQQSINPLDKTESK